MYLEVWIEQREQREKGFSSCATHVNFFVSTLEPKLLKRSVYAELIAFSAKQNFEPVMQNIPLSAHAVSAEEKRRENRKRRKNRGCEEERRD